MPTSLDPIANEVLTLIEYEESKLLNWGFVSGSIDLGLELPGLLGTLPRWAASLWTKEEQAGASADAILNNLLERQLIFRLPDGNYRSRFSESVRLLFLLRQRFKENDWATASRLVSDLRLELQRRRYPRRDVESAEFIEQLKDIGKKATILAAIRELVQGSDGQEIRLSRFQVEAVLRQFSNLDSGRDRALVIGAGTGAGKTKAFYIPALAYVAQNIDPALPHLQVLTIYPRNELLKDQLAEAFAEARKLDDWLVRQGKRPLTLGAYHGDVPESAKALKDNPQRYGWRRSPSGMGLVCPYFNCPSDPRHELVWEDADLQAEIKASGQRLGQHARLLCSSCGHEIASNHLLLTRQQLRRQPPDVLFTSTEMLNRRMSRAEEHQVFGIGQQARAPRLMLLDEIHTYEGIHGAQVAYLIRRWRHARGHPSDRSLCIVGLSATLTSAVEFFSRLTGLDSSDVDYISPQEEELVEEGAEYNVVLKGDPVSRTSLLSTSVQTGMLIARTLDPLSSDVSRGTYGQKTFAFTDKLDVINRWYYAMHDAESKPLSRLRRSEGIDALDKRKTQGQAWDMCERIGHDLGQGLRLGRTTSQDPGVNQAAVLTIATSTLEVGYNDPAVGAILQHKAPRSAASFLQRKGRAGRTRGMRPWTVVVVSGYGRDRWAFQHAETLFSPSLPPLDLPVGNYYVQKIQAAYALMDWAAQSLRRYEPSVDVWRLLSGGTSGHRPTRERLCRLLLDVLEGPKRKSFEDYVLAALDVSRSELDIILWSEPRPLYLEVIPTLVRQLETSWATGRPGEAEMWTDNASNQPMPDFIPAALFTDLNLPEVTLQLPSHGKRAQSAEDLQRTLSLTQAISEYAPGRANKRFVLAYHRDVAHWLALPDEAQLTRGMLSLDLLSARFDEIPSVTRIAGETHRVFRPRSYTLQELPGNMLSTSYSELLWRSQFSPSYVREDSEQLAGSAIDLPPRSLWRRFLRTIRVFTHNNGESVEVTRAAVGVRVQARFRGGESHVRTLYFEHEGTPAAIGFTMASDALQFVFEPLDTAALRALDVWPRLYQYFGPEFFRTKLHRDIRLQELGLSIFAIDWLWQLELSMITATAVSRQSTLLAAAEEVDARRIDFADRTLRAIFQSQRSEEESGEDPGRLHAELLGYEQDPLVVATLRDAETVLWNDEDPELASWLEESYASTLGSAVFTAITDLIPEIDPEQLVLDVDVTGAIAWVTETSAGGVGLVARIADAIAQKPHDLELRIADAIDHCPREQLSHQLRDVTALVGSGTEHIRKTFADIRRHNDLLTLRQSKEQLSDALEAHGVPITRSLVMALNAKFLRPNSDSDSDQLIVDLVDQWQAESTRLGTAIDLRVMAVVGMRLPAIESQVQALLKRIGAGQEATEDQMFNLLQSLLWLDCQDSCPDCLERSHVYQQLVRPSRALVQALQEEDYQQVDFGTDGWGDSVSAALTNAFQVRIRCQPSEIFACKAQIAQFLTTPLDIGYQRHFPVVESIRQKQGRWIIYLTVLDMTGG